MPEFPALAHIAVTVTDLDRSWEWYSCLFDSMLALDEDAGGFYHVAFALGDGTMFGLHRLDGTSPSDRFDERHVGLDHVAFTCTSRAELEKWRSQLDKLGIPHGGIVDASYGSGLSFRDPDNIALEFFAPPS